VRPERRASVRGAAAVGAFLVLLLSPAAAQDTPDTPAGPEAPDTLSETYRDWVLSCAPVAQPDPANPTTRSCEIAQEVGTAETGQRVLRMALVRDGDGGGDGAAAVALVTPFGVRLADGVGIAAAGSDLARADFLTCLQSGCVATGTLDAAMLDTLQAAQTATITMNSTSGASVTVDLSLAGFAAAWQRLGALE
jgi:invasion protein IalB